MPGMDGVALIGEAQKHCPGLPALLLTGYAEDDIDLALSGVATGAFSLLRKPVRAAYLIDRIAAALQARATATAQRPTATTA
jgi:FixJ family two-component response regulator